MKKAQLLLLVAVCFCTLASAQTTPKELGVRFSDINFGGNNGFSLVYKKQKSENKYVRWRATFGNISVNSIEGVSDNFNFGVGANFGIEKRKALGEKFQFCRGPEFGAGFNLSDSDGGDASVSVDARFGYVLGLQYNATRNLFVNLETLPGVVLDVNSFADDVSVSGSIGFNSFAALTLGFRF